jgi:hypothetical protein
MKQIGLHLLIQKAGTARRITVMLLSRDCVTTIEQNLSQEKLLMR